MAKDLVGGSAAVFKTLVASNHKNDSRGKCIECEAYFARLTTTIEEVR